jgi:hypothetical protein
MARKKLIRRRTAVLKAAVVLPALQAAWLPFQPLGTPLEARYSVR